MEVDFHNDSIDCPFRKNRIESRHLAARSESLAEIKKGLSPREFRRYSFHRPPALLAFCIVILLCSTSFAACDVTKKAVSQAGEDASGEVGATAKHVTSTDPDGQLDKAANQRVPSRRAGERLAEQTEESTRQVVKKSVKKIVEDTTKAATRDTIKVAEHAYVGVSTCKMCHMPHFKAWKDTSHAEAFEILNTEEKEDANPKCLECHTTGFGRGGYETGKSSPDLKGVQCEACHGPGADYMKLSVMRDLEKAKDAGLVYPVGESVCVECHNKESPTFKGFDFKRYLAGGVHRVKKETDK